MEEKQKKWFDAGASAILPVNGLDWVILHNSYPSIRRFMERNAQANTFLTEHDLIVRFTDDDFEETINVSLGVTNSATFIEVGQISCQDIYEEAQLEAKGLIREDVSVTEPLVNDTLLDFARELFSEDELSEELAFVLYKLFEIQDTMTMFRTIRKK